MTIQRHSSSTTFSSCSFPLTTFYVVLLIITRASSAVFSPSDLCFLSHGGSSETFTINEAVPVGSIIGVLKVIGDVPSSEGGQGNIELSLDELSSRFEGSDIPVTIEEGSKRLVLTRKLDKEGPEGSEGVVVGVKCRKLTSPHEPSIIIPVRIVVTDANDHAPEFLGTPYSVNVSEGTSVGSILLPSSVIRAIDDDQPGAFSTVEYYIEPGPFSHFVKFENPSSGNLILASSLDYETLPKFWVTIRAQDQGEPPNTATTTVTVTVIDANDHAPEFLGAPYSVNVSEGIGIGSILLSSSVIRAIDNDQPGPFSTVQYFIEPGPFAHLAKFDNPSSGNLILTSLLDYETLPKFWLTIRAQDQGKPPNRATTTVTVNVIDANDHTPEFLGAPYVVNVSEVTAVGSIFLTSSVVRAVDNDQSGPFSTVEYSIEPGPFSHFAKFENPSSGNLVLASPLDYETLPKFWLTIRAQDQGDPPNTATTTVTVNVIDANDHGPEFIGAPYSVNISELAVAGSVLLPSSVIRAIDHDEPGPFSTVEYYVEPGPFSHLAKFENPSSGNLILTHPLDHETLPKFWLTIRAQDLGEPPNTASTTVTVNVIDTNDQNLRFIDYKYKSKEAVDVNALLGASGSSAIVLVIVLGVLLATLFIIIIILTVHVLKQRKFSGSPSTSSTPSSGSASPTNPYTQYFHNSNGRPSFSQSKSTEEERQTSDVTTSFNPPIVAGMGPRGVENPIFSLNPSPPNGTSNTVNGTSTGQQGPSNLNSRYFSDGIIGVRSPSSDHESGVLSDSSSQERPQQETENQEEEDELVDMRSTGLSPPPPPPVPSSVTCTTIGPGGSISSGSGNSSRVSVVKWPQGSIPRRVKKLTWEDEIPPHPSPHYHHPSQSLLPKEEQDEVTTNQSHTHSNSSQSNSNSLRSSHTLASHVNKLQDANNLASVTTTFKSGATTGLASVSASSPVPRMGDHNPIPSSNSFGHVTNGLSDLTVYF